MSGDPERLLSSMSNADPHERELLGSVRHVGPPEGAKDEAWRRIAGQIAVVTAVGTATSTTAAAASKASAGTFASWALSAKVVAVVAVGSLALGGGYVALRNKPQTSLRVAAPRVAAPPATHAVPAVSLALPSADRAPPPPEATPEEAKVPKPELRRLDLLKAESALLMDARAQLRSGNAAAAQASLDRLQAQFPKGVLTQEREVLAIEVLFARGNVEGAKRRARAFVKQYPNSPHSAKLARSLE